MDPLSHLIARSNSNPWDFDPNTPDFSAPLVAAPSDDRVVPSVRQIPRRELFRGAIAGAIGIVVGSKVPLFSPDAHVSAVEPKEEVFEVTRVIEQGSRKVEDVFFEGGFEIFQELLKYASSTEELRVPELGYFHTFEIISPEAIIQMFNRHIEAQYSEIFDNNTGPTYDKDGEWFTTRINEFYRYAKSFVRFKGLSATQERALQESLVIAQGENAETQYVDKNIIYSHLGLEPGDYEQISKSPEGINKIYQRIRTVTRKAYSEMQYDLCKNAGRQLGANPNDEATFTIRMGTLEMTVTPTKIILKKVSGDNTVHVREIHAPRLTSAVTVNGMVESGELGVMIVDKRVPIKDINFPFGDDENGVGRQLTSTVPYATNHTELLPKWDLREG